MINQLGRLPFSHLSVCRAIAGVAALLVLPKLFHAAETDPLPHAEPPSLQVATRPEAATVALPGLGPDELDRLPESTAGQRWAGITRTQPSDFLPNQQPALASEAWLETAAGPVWRLRVVSPHAKAVRLHFKEMDLAGGSLWVHSGSDQAFGPYSGAGPFGDGDFWGPSILGDSAVIEYLPAESLTTDLPVPFRVAEVGHFWQLPEELVNESSQSKAEEFGSRSSEPRAAVIPKRWMSATIDSATEGQRLVSHVPSGFRFPPSVAPTVYAGDVSYTFAVTDSMESVTLAVHSLDPNSDVDLYVRFQDHVEVVDGLVVADNWVESSNSDEELVISRRSDPPLRTGDYYISLANHATLTSSAGTITVTPEYSNHSCYHDATCRTQTDNDLAHWSSAVALITFADDETGRLGSCSGVLLNNSETDVFESYFLTAAHCVNSKSEARSVEAFWFFQSRVCSGAPSRGVNELDARYTRTSGATLLAFEDGSLRADGRIDQNGDGDIALLRLSGSLPRGLTYMGWTTNLNAISIGTNVIGIHHAEAVTKQISFGEISQLFGDMLYVEWANGLTLSGASGSPLISEDGRVFGVLSGGRDDHEGCFDQGSPTLYSSFRAFFPEIRGYFRADAPTDDNPQHIQLEPGSRRRFSLAASTARTLQNGTRSYTVDVPAGSTRLTLSLVSDSPSVDVDMYVRFQSDNTLSNYNWVARSNSGNETITIDLSSNPPLRPGIYYVSLRLYDNSGVSSSGTLTAQLTRATTDPFGIEFVRIPSGQFHMGSVSRESGSDESPISRVRISNGFWIGRHEITQRQWSDVMGDNPSRNQGCGPECPVDSVSWEDIRGFIRRVNSRAGPWSYRLPTEAEWEYAARAETIGDRYGQLDSIAWWQGNSSNRVHAVGSKSPNGYGLFDMLGNVWELVEDRGRIYRGGLLTDPIGAQSGSYRVVRGGAWNTSADRVRAPERSYLTQSLRNSTVGFRLVRSEKPGFPVPDMDFVLIPSGDFSMGSTSREAVSDETPATRVRIRSSFWLGKYEVTQGQWESVMGVNPSVAGQCGEDCPVENVSWTDIQTFIRRLNSEDTRWRYRLPTEAEWEYAARAGSTTSRYGSLDLIAWWQGNSGRRSRPVGGKMPNSFGLYDMIGNVWEWVADWFGAYPGGTVTDPRGPLSGTQRVVRGGGFLSSSSAIRVANRHRTRPDNRSSGRGFRLVRMER